MGKTKNRTPEQQPAAKNPTDEKIGSQTLFVDGVIGCFSFSFEGVIEWANSRVSELLGYSNAELIGRNFVDLCYDSPDGITKAKDILQRFKKGETIHDEQLLMRKADGLPLWTGLNITAAMDGGKVIYGSSTLIDISEHKRTEEALKRNFDAQQAIDSILQLSLSDASIKDILDNTLHMLFLIPWLSVESKGAIFLIDKTDDSLVLESEHGLSDAIKTACEKVPMGYCLCGRAVQSLETVYCNNLDERHDITYEGIAPHGHYCIPMVSKGEAIGVLNCYLEPGHERKEAEVRFLSSVANVLAGVVERRRAEEALKRSEAYTRSLLRIARQMEQARDHVEILKVASIEVKEVLGYNSTWLAVTDPTRKEVDIIRIEGSVAEIEKSLSSDEELHKRITHFEVKGDRLLEDVIDKLEPVVVEEAIDDPRFNRTVVEAYHNRSMVSVPVELMDGSIAVLSTGTFGDEGVKVPTEDELDYFISIASQIAVILDRFLSREQSARAEAMLKQNYETQAAISSILRLTLEKLELSGLLEQALHILFAIPWLAVESKGSISLVDDTGDSLVMVSEHGLSGPIKSACGKVPMGYCLCGRAAETSEPTYCSDIDERHDIAYEGMTPHGHYCIPMLSKGNVIGVLNFYLEAGHERDETEMTFLSSAANILAGVVERRRAEDALTISEERLRDIADNALEWIWEVDVEGKYTYSNPIIEKVLGYSSAEIHDMHFYDLLHPDDREEVKRQAFEFFENRLPFREFLNRNISKDGATVWLSTNAVPLLDDNGDLIGYRGADTDITERIRSEEELKRSEKYTRSLLRLSQAMEKARSAKDIVQVAFTEVKEILGYNSTWLGFGNEEGEVLHLLVQQGSTENFVETDQEFKVKGDAWLEEMVAARGPMILEDARTDPRVDQKIVERDGYRSMLCMPVRLMDESLVVLCTGTFGDEGIKVPTSEQVDYFASMARSIAIVLDRLRFLEEREQAQREVVKEKNFTESAIRNIPGIFFLNHKKKGMVKWNTELEIMTGFTAQEITSMSLLDFFVDREREKVTGILDDVYKKGYARGEASISNKLRNTIPLLISASLVDLDDDEYTIGTCIDISMRKKAELALKESEKKYRTLFEESQDVVFISNLGGHFLDVNPAGVRLFGYSSEEELVGSRHERKLYVNENDPEVLKQLISQQGYVSNYELPMKTKQGNDLVVFLTANAVRNDVGDVIAYRGIIRDMTDYRKLEEQLIQAQKMESVGRLAGGLSHDLNNYLTAIQGYTDLALMELPESSDASINLKEARRSSDRAATLTKQLLLFSRREAMEIGPVELNTVINDLLKMLNQLVGEQFHLKTRLAKDLKTINADTGYIEQVIMNLVVNARDAMPGGGEIFIGTENITINESYTRTHPNATAGEFARMTVKDTGMGMDEQVISRIFEPFFSTKKTGKGTGLGLSVVHGIVSQHGGWIEVDSSPGKGTTFMIYLPTTKPAIKELEEEYALTAEPSGHGEKILLVEDDQVVRTLTKKLLEKCGYRVSQAADAAEALNVFEDKEGDFRLVLSDVVLPHEDGIQLVDQLRRRKPDLKILLMSGYSDEAHRKAIRAKGFTFLRKPYTIPDLIQAINSLLAGEDQINM